MARNLITEKDFRAWPPPGYATLGRLVYLGRASKRAKDSAKAAGLRVTSLTGFRTAYTRMTAGDRMVRSGTWYDTVKY